MNVLVDINMCFEIYIYLYYLFRNEKCFNPILDTD